MTETAPLSHAALFAAPIPKRFPPLVWRRPVALWAPAALVLAFGWPALALRGDDGMLQAAGVAGAAAILLGAVSLAAFALLGHPARARRAVISHLLAAGALAALAMPFALALLAAQEKSAWFALVPLALMLGLPLSLFAGLVVSWVAFVKPPRLSENEILLEDSVPADVETYEITRDPATLV